MDGHPVEDAIKTLKESLEKLRQENDELQEEKGELNREIVDLQGAAEEAEISRDRAHDQKEEAFYALRQEKRKSLDLLRRLEFCLHGLCPLCLGIVEHKTGCDLKLAIWRADHELNRTEYVHL